MKIKNNLFLGFLLLISLLFSSCEMLGLGTADDFTKAISSSDVKLWRSETELFPNGNTVDCCIYELSFNTALNTVVIATFKWNSGYDTSIIKHFNPVSETHEYCYYKYDSDGNMYLSTIMKKRKDYNSKEIVEVNDYEKDKWILMNKKLDFSKCSKKELIFNGIEYATSKDSYHRNDYPQSVTRDTSGMKNN